MGHMSLVCAVLLADVAATWFMVGLIWFVQIVHYPQFAHVGAEGFCAFHRRHTTLTTWIVGPPMLVEAATSIALLWWSAVASWIVWVGLATVAVNWLSTAALQVPKHNLLANGFDPAAARSLCRTNWIRTVAWSIHGIILLVALNRLISL